MIHEDLIAMGVEDVSIIGVGKDTYNSDLPGMIDGRILPWVEDVEEDGYPVWTDYGAVQRSTYFLDRDGALLYQFNITTLDPNDPEDYYYLINLILDYRANDGPNILRVNQGNPSIQANIDMAYDGDIILVDPGLYQGQIDFLDKNITLATLIYSGYGEEDIERSILDGDGVGPVVTINGGQDQSSILLGFVIKNGNAEESGGGILIEDSSPTIDRNIIHHNQAGSCGGSGAGIAIIGESYPHVFGNTIHDNIVSGDCDCDCYFGGGIFVDTESWPIVGGSITLGNVIYDNFADNGSELYRDDSGDTTNWTPIYAHHNFFDNCPPSIQEVYPTNGWDLAHCHEINSLGIEETLPNENLFLYPNYPNPFNASTNIKIFQSDPRTAELFIYDIRGMVVFFKKLESFSGTNIINWNASEQSSGLYFIKLRNNVFSKTQKAILVK